MGKQIKNTIAILLAFCFLLSLTATAVAADSLYIGDQAGNGTVEQFNATSGAFIKTFVSENSGGLVGPFGLVFENNGNLLLANGNIGLPIPGDILRFNGITGAFERALANGTGAPYQPNGIVLKDNIIYAADLGDLGVPGNVSTYNEHNGNFLGNLNQNVIPPLSYHPRAVVFGPDGNLYVSVRNITANSSTGQFDPASNLGGHVLRFNPDGSFKDDFINDTGGVGHLNRPIGLVFGPDGNLYITSFRANPDDTNSIRIYNKTGVFLKKINLDTPESLGGVPNQADALLFGPDGRLFAPISGPVNYINDHGAVRRYNVTDGSYDNFIKPGGELQWPWFLTFGNTDPKTLDYILPLSTPEIIWDNPTDICRGMPLRYGDQLNASAADQTSGAIIPGTFNYDPSVGTVLREGQHQPLKVTFVPGDSTKYATATKTVHINVNECPEKHGFFHQTEYSTFLPFQWG